MIRETQLAPYQAWRGVRKGVSINPHRSGVHGPDERTETDHRPPSLPVGRLIIFLIVFSAASTPLLHAQQTGFGLGVIAGEPTGVSAKLWVSPDNAFDAGVAWAFGDGGRFHLHADYLWHFSLQVPRTSGSAGMRVWGGDSRPEKGRGFSVSGFRSV